MVAASKGGKTRYVYFIQSGESGPIKIGETNNPSVRLATHQIGSAERLRMLSAPETRPTLNERSLHAAFAKHRLHGEWFAPADEILRVARFWAAPPACCPDCDKATAHSPLTGCPE